MPKKILLILLLILILTGGITITGFYIRKKLTQPQEELVIFPPTKPEEITSETTPTQPSEIDTSNWKTYRNRECGYEVKYPEDWRMELYETHHKTVWGAQCLTRWYPPWVPPEKIDVVIEVNINNNPEGYSIPMALFGKPMACENVKIGDLIFCKLVKKREKAKDVDILSYSLSKNNKIYTVGMVYDLPESEIQPEFKIFNQMLSTFKIE